MARLGHNLAKVAMVAVVLGGSIGSANAIDIDFGRYAAIAYSKETGKYGYAYNYGSKGVAEREALSMCPASDAKIVGWVKGGWVVLAIGEENAYGIGWEYGDGAVNSDAANRAIKELNDQEDKCKTLVIVCSGDVRPQVINRSLKKELVK